MKTLIVRAFVLTLAISGSVAYTQINNDPTHVAVVSMPSTNFLPVPTCPPDDPNACGLKSGK